MKIIKESLVGTLESSDIQIMILPNEDFGIEIQLKSNVEKQFGKQIRKVIIETLQKLGVENVKVIATDRGALDCTIRARLQCAVYRACGIEGNYDWEALE
ncbi:citrate lyase acyl carrier protein [Clostridium sp. KNHs214]|uniref:citrate lyase acyl carrier protein n=1 Tax=Clostridium sp. KNHs214 TaxID=1540257 RepID=UPI000551B0D9|nr:citrate lyase acyl carrier protein [Clostridium sp. KNHs214]